MILFEKFGQHQPLNRQAERYAREGVDLSLSTLADQVGACTLLLRPIFERLEAHVLAAARLHGDDTTVPVLAKGKTDIARCWTYVRDAPPFAGPAPPVAVFYYSRDRRGEHPTAHLRGWAGVLQADAYGGYCDLYAAQRQPAPILEAACWAHARRKFFVLADIAASARRKGRGKAPAVISPMALEAVRRIDALFKIEREINGQSADQRQAMRQELSAPLVADLQTWMALQRAKLSRGADLAKAMDYMLKRWTAFSRFLGDGRICLTNNAAERALRGIALGRKSWLFAGSDRGGERAAFMYSLIVTAKLNDIDPQAWLADVLARIADHPAHQLDELLPWNWRPITASSDMAARSPSEAEKSHISATCQRFIDEILKPRFLPAIRPTPFNYCVDIQGKWQGPRYRFIQRYRSGFPHNLGEEFDAPFVRLDWISPDRFDIQWHRHTGAWYRLHRSQSLAQALKIIETDGILHPH